MVEQIGNRIRYQGEYDEEAYWERVDRNLAFLGRTEEEARRNQEKLRDATIGIAGVGGIGGAAAIRLVRMGARHLKVADPEGFEMSNIQRQAGASLDTLGRNKAEVTAEIAYELTRDADIEVFTDGINPDNPAEFVEGCDIIADQIEFYERVPRYALHKAARESETCKAIVSVATVGHGALVLKYRPDSTSAEDVWGLDGDQDDAETAKAFIEKMLPSELIPAFPGRETLFDWLIKRQTAPIWGAAPAVCEGVLVDLICNEVIGFPGMVDLPLQPGYAWIDMFSWSSGIVRPDEAPQG
jgi:molybdopterin/thiamine biosynthesis adenylyltransferase